MGVHREYTVGDYVKLKKPHPCGSQTWEILRTGADFRLRCTGCGHQIMVPRKLVEKNTREVIHRNPEDDTISEGGGLDCVKTCGIICDMSLVIIHEAPGRLVFVLLTR